MLKNKKKYYYCYQYCYDERFLDKEKLGKAIDQFNSVEAY